MFRVLSRSDIAIARSLYSGGKEVAGGFRRGVIHRGTLNRISEDVFLLYGKRGIVWSLVSL